MAASTLGLEDVSLIKIKPTSVMTAPNSKCSESLYIKKCDVFSLQTPVHRPVWEAKSIVQ